MVFGNFTVARCLLDAKADPWQREAGTGFDAFLAAVRFGCHKNIEAWLKYLDEARFSLERSEFRTGMTALPLALIYDGGPETMQVLLNAKADPRHIDWRGDSILHSMYLCENDTSGLLPLLRSTGVDVNWR